MIREVQRAFDRFFGRVRLARPVVCRNPRCKRVRKVVSEFEQTLLGQGVSLGCHCGHSMRPTPHPSDTDRSHIGRGARHYGNGDQQ